MKCPNCHKTGNTFKRIFSKRGNSTTKFCIYCNVEVNIIYNWKKIFLLVFVVILLLIIFDAILKYYEWPGISPGFAGGMAGATIAIFMQRPPFLRIEQIAKKKKRN